MAKPADTKKEVIVKKAKNSPKAIKSFGEALQILIGAGIVVDQSKNVQYWVLGKKYSEKVRKAGGFLDSMVDSGTGKAIFKTEWVHEATYKERFRELRATAGKMPNKA